MAGVLNKVIALGAHLGSTELRDWARNELQGYGPGDEVPEYRKIIAPLLMDAGTMTGIIKGQQISPWQLPDFAQDKISEDLIMPKPVIKLAGGMSDAKLVALKQREIPGFDFDIVHNCGTRGNVVLAQRHLT